MEIHLNILAEKLAHHKPKVYINNQYITTIKSVKYLEQNIVNLDSNTLYIGDDSSLSIDLQLLNKINLLIVSENQVPNLLVEKCDVNIIFISSKSVLSVFNEVLDIIYEYQKLIEGTSKFMAVLSKGNDIQQIVDVGFELIGNPIFIRDRSFKILAFTQNIQVDDHVWNDITSKGYQSYNGFQYLIKHSFMETTNNTKVPVYFKNLINKADEIKDQCSQGKLIKTGIDKNMSFILKPTFDPERKVTMSRVWSNIHIGNKIVGQVVALEAFKSFTESDIALIKSLSDTISLELQRQKSYESFNESKQDLLILDLLDRKIRDLDTLEERLKFISWNFKNTMRIITITTDKKNISEIPLIYISGFLKNVFGDSSCILYDGVIVGIFSCSVDKRLSDLQVKKINEFMKDTNMISGISRTFNNLLDIRKHYEESLKAIESGKHLNNDNVLFFYDDYILQHFFSLCSGTEALKGFCHPSIFILINYDRHNRTSYVKSLYSYIMNFKSPSELASSMNIHRNTLYYRISKIEELMNINLSNIDDFFSIYLSFKILEYLGEDIV